MASMGTAFKTSMRWLWLFVALLIIGTVILVVIGRQTIAYVDQVREPIEQFLTEQIGLQVDLGELRGEWPRLVPIIEVDHASIFASDNTPVFEVTGVRADLDLFNSLLRWTPIWRELAVDSLSLTLVEDQLGSWSLKSLSSNGDTDLSLIVDPLTYSRLIRFDDVQTRLEFYSGKTMGLNAHNVAMENADEFHRAELALSLLEEMQPVAEKALTDSLPSSNTSSSQGASPSSGSGNITETKASPAYLLIEGQGDLTDIESLSADGYFRFDELNLSEPVADLIRTLLPELFANLPDFKANAQGEIWFALHPGGSADFEGNLAIGEVPLNWLADVPPVTDIKTEITGWFTPGSDWGLRLQGFNLAWSDTEIKPLNLVFNQRLGSQWHDFDLSVNHLDLTLLSELLDATRIAEQKVLDIVDRLQPRGIIDALTLGHNEAGYYASANLQALDIAAWKKAPGVRGLDGYLEVYGSHGMLSLADTDGFEALFPTVYKDYQSIEKAEGTINFSWDKDIEKLTMRSDVMRAELDVGVASILFSAEQFIPSKGLPPAVSLLIGARDLDAKKRNKYLPYRMPDKLRTWLQTSILDAHVDELGLLIRNHPPRLDKLSQSTQLMVKISAADIDYDPKWTGIRNSSALALVDDAYTEVQVYSGTVGGTSISSAEVVYDQIGADQTAVITVAAEVEGDLSSAMTVLAESPLRDRLGALTGWDYDGEMTSQLDLVIPLVSAGSESIAPQYNVSSLIDSGSLSIPGGPISATEINGQLNFSLDKGIYGDDVSAYFWQRPMDVNFYKEAGDQKIAVIGDLLPESLNQLVTFPWQKVIKGLVAVDSLITIPAAENQQGADDSPITLQITSQLKGVELDLPAPLAKAKDKSQALNITLSFAPELESLQGSLAGRHSLELDKSADLNFDLRFNESGMSGAHISYDRAKAEPQPGTLMVSGHLPTTDFKLWQPLISLFQGSESSPQVNWIPVFDLRLDSMDLLNLQLQDIQATTSLREGIVDTQFVTDLADGQLLMSTVDTEQIPVLKLSRLSIPDGLLSKSVSDSKIDPRQFMALDFSVDRLQVGSDKLGSIAFKLRPEVSGAAFGEIRGDLLGLQPGLFKGQPATEFFWGFDGSDYASRLIGPVGIGNIEEFLSAGLNVPKIVDSESGRFVFDLAWQDQPWKISRDNLSGEFQVKLEEGSFYRSTGGAGAALKMVSLVNFANWLRRLKLDFSDVTGQNLSYNKLNGTLEFDQGVASFKQPLRMDMPSGRMSMGGEFDLLNEEVDARLVATLPVATNLPWVVALLGGLPAAAGVYVTSKLVEKQVDRLSSISYKLTGSWDDVEVSVDRIFAADLRAENNTASKADQELDTELDRELDKELDKELGKEPIKGTDRVEGQGNGPQ
jgi:uncharacterized protein YhdP